MRPRFHWDAYDSVNYQLSFLCNPPYKEIIQLVGCNNRYGMTEQQIIDNCKLTMKAETLKMAIGDLHQQGLLREEMGSYHEFFSDKRVYYKVNWSVIKQINNAVKRMP